MALRRTWPLRSPDKRAMAASELDSQQRWPNATRMAKEAAKGTDDSSHGLQTGDPPTEPMYYDRVYEPTFEASVQLHVLPAKVKAQQAQPHGSRLNVVLP